MKHTNLRTKQIFGKMNLCKLFGIHNWKFYSKRVKLKTPNDINREFITVPLRECKKCGKLEHHLMPTMNGMDLNWKDGEKFRNCEEFTLKSLNNK